LWHMHVNPGPTASRGRYSLSPIATIPVLGKLLCNAINVMG